MLGCLIRMNKSYNEGTRYAGKLARTVWSGGKSGDDIKGLPIAITGYADRKGSGWLHPGTKRSFKKSNVKEKAGGHGERKEKLCLRK